MRNELINMPIYYKLIYTWYILYVGTFHSHWHMEVLCKHMRLLPPTSSLPPACEEMRVRRKSTQQIPTRNTKNDSQKLRQRRSRGDARLLRTTQEAPSSCPMVGKSFELEPKRLGPGQKKTWRPRDPRGKTQPGPKGRILRKGGGCP